MQQFSVGARSIQDMQYSGFSRLLKQSKQLQRIAEHSQTETEHRIRYRVLAFFILDILFENAYILQAGGEANEVGAETEAGARAGRRANRRGVDVEDGEHGEGRQGDGSDLLDAELLAR